MVKIDKLFFKSKVKKYIHSRGFRVSSKILDDNALDNIIKSILDKGIRRTKANKRKTVKPNDVYIRPMIPIPEINQEILEGIITELHGSGAENRGLMYYDIITHIIRDHHEEPEYDRIMLWCNANIKNGETFLN